MKKLSEKLNEISVGKVLEVGAGLGDFTYYLSQNLKSYSEIIGTEPDKATVEKANKALQNPKIKFIVMSGENLDFDDASFDMVAISNTLHHLSDIEKTLTEMKRILKPGGIFLIKEILNESVNNAQKTQVMLHQWKARIDRIAGRYHEPPFDMKKVKEIARNLKLKEYKVTGYFDLPKSDDNIKDYGKIEGTINSNMREINALCENNTIPEEERDTLIEKGEIIRSRYYEAGIERAKHAIVIGIK